MKIKSTHRRSKPTQMKPRWKANSILSMEDEADGDHEAAHGEDADSDEGRGKMQANR